MLRLQTQIKDDGEWSPLIALHMLSIHSSSWGFHLLPKPPPNFDTFGQEMKWKMQYGVSDLMQTP